MDRVLILGKGAREHALAFAFLKTGSQVFVMPGNGGILRPLNRVNVPLSKQNVLEFIRQNNVDYVVIGPEDLLADGYVDFLEANGIRVFGPSMEAARFESSKIFAKEFMSNASIPTSPYRIVSSIDDLFSAQQEFGFPIVLKEDGLKAGKGVYILKNKDELLAKYQQLKSQRFLLEKYIDGIEASFTVIIADNGFVVLPTSKDHKKIGEGEKGLNTGGMGTLSPNPYISKELEKKIINEIILKFINAIRQKNIKFRGVLFVGLMIKNNNVFVLEFNVRFGDPEIQSIIPRINLDDFVEIIKYVASYHKIPDRFLSDGRLFSYIKEHDIVTCNIVLASKGYPLSYPKNVLIGKDVPSGYYSDRQNEYYVFHAGTEFKDGKFYSVGGRVLNVCALGKNISDARIKAYLLVKKLAWKESYYRRDIGL